ncbi:unnamed protein product [Polarella glacialis]|uniref:VTT domain-containing protein n=1 Tax=Polarella glacialis TaxID=89957 RepID=A0A813JKH4_POLGL|nr:unnamed protein product [Polarella glacialis]
MADLNAHFCFPATCSNHFRRRHQGRPCRGRALTATIATAAVTAAFISVQNPERRRGIAMACSYPQSSARRPLQNAADNILRRDRISVRGQGCDWVSLASGSTSRGRSLPLLPPLPERFGGARLHGRNCRRGSSRPVRHSGVGMLLDQLPGQVAALGPLGPAYFCFAYALALCCAVPATPLTITAGYLFGLPLGFGCAVLAAGVAGSISFLLSRTFLRPMVSRLAAGSEVFRRLNRAVELKGFSIIFLLRLSPLMPFSILSYSCGLSRVRFPIFLCANVLGFIPATLGLTFLTTTVHRLSKSGSSMPWPALAACGVLTALLVGLAAKVAQRAVETAEAEEKAARAADA